MGTMNEDEAMFFERTRQNVLSNAVAEHGQSSASSNEHYNSSEDDEKKGDMESEEADTANYIKTDDNDIFGNMKDDEIGRQSEFEDGDSITPPSDSRSEIDSVDDDDMKEFIEKV